MRNRVSHRYRRGTSRAALAICGVLAACGGGGGYSSKPRPTAAAYLYVASRDVDNRAVPGAVYQYSIGGDGSLTPLAVASVPTGVTPLSMISDPSGSHVYVASRDGNIWQYAVGMDGALAPLSPASVGIGGPYALAPGGGLVSVDPAGGFLYVVTIPQDPAGPSASIEQFSIGGDGTLTPLSPAYIEVPAFGYGPLAIDPRGHFAYLAGASSAPGGLVSSFSIAADGRLSPLTPASVAAPARSIGVTIAPDGQFAYALSLCVDSACDGQVTQYTIGADGALSSTGATTLTGGNVNPVAMLTDDSGSYAYLLTNLMGVDTNTGAVYQYTVGGTGQLLADSPPSLRLASGSVADGTFGSQLYALSALAVGSVSPGGAGGFIDRYAIGSGGVLSALDSTPLAVSEPAAMALVAAH